MSNQPTCLIMGANGFIGSHLVDELAEKQYAVRAFDRSMERPRHKPAPNIESISGDFFDDIVVGQALKNIDYVFHVFSATTPFTSDSDPYTDINQNILRNVQLFEKFVEADVKKVVFISSGGAVYGHIAEERPARETDAPNPVSPYGISKLATEYYLTYFKRKYDLNHITYRLTNPYGPRQPSQNSQGVIPIFLDKINRGEELLIYGDGGSSRDYLYVRDATNMMVESFAKDTAYDTYNIGSGQQTDLTTVIQTIEKATGKTAKLRYQDAPKTFLEKTMVSVDRFNQEFTTRATTSLEAGVRHMLA